VVRVAKSGKAPWFDLPGGAVDPGEDALQAVVREFGEETGLVVRPGEELDRAAQYFLSNDDAPYRNHGPLLIVHPMGDDPTLKIEDDHKLIWLEPGEALRKLRHDSHAWAVACWLRKG
jgi:8-oxo-dGTP diphosphatase